MIGLGIRPGQLKAHCDWPGNQARTTIESHYSRPGDQARTLTRVSPVIKPYSHRRGGLYFISHHMASSFQQFSWLQLVAIECILEFEVLMAATIGLCYHQE